MDSLIAKFSALPQQPVIFSANLILAHGVGVKGVPTKALLEYIDALKAAGAQRIQFNPAVTSIDDPEVMARYDAVVKHLRELSLQVQINLVYARIGNRNADMAIRDFRDFAVPAVKACAQFAARYHPDYLVPVHEPLTMNVRMGIRAGPPAWVQYLDDAVRAIKRASPNTLVGAGGWYRELPYYRAFAAMPSLDFLTIDIYDQTQLGTAAATRSQLGGRDRIPYYKRGGLREFRGLGREVDAGDGTLRFHAWDRSGYPVLQSDFLRLCRLGAGPPNRSRIQRKSNSSDHAGPAHKNL
ncbi:MAG: hypothetical protein ABSG65_12360 [Bryobacteraceae bacterium]